MIMCLYKNCLLLLSLNGAGTSGHENQVNSVPGDVLNVYDVTVLKTLDTFYLVTSNGELLIVKIIMRNGSL